MADKKISALTSSTTPLAGTEVLPIVQSSATVKVAVSDLTAGRAVSALSLSATTGAAVGGATAGAGGVAFPATAVAVADANTLDDYEEGTWTPSQLSGLTVVGAFSSSGRYTKIGRMIYISGRLAGSTSIATTAGTQMMGNLPFTISEITAVGTITNGAVDVIGGVGAFTSGSNLAYSATTIAATASIDFSLIYSI
jgi:hypothetical protein